MNKLKLINKQLGIAFKIIGIGLVCLIPTPIYGWYGGFYNVQEKDGPEPVDNQDYAYAVHDLTLENNYNAWIDGINMANKALVERLEKHPPMPNWYAKIYHRMALLIFKRKV